ncbi:MAG: secretin N-terminal domain-containing protein [Candidatus Omnitrophota bacterium]|nr:secretin N-terminal domain-containing protein [Candidatus Omnitrophota bacterium]
MRKFIVSISLLLIFSGLVFAVQQDDTDLISLDLKGMDIRDVLKILSQKSGLNIVADSGVKGAITLYLKDVSAMDAIGIVTSTNGLAYEQTGTLVRIMDAKEYEKAHGRSFEDRTKTEIIKLNYANAGEVAKALSQIKSDIGKVISEDVSNTIVIIDIPDNIKKMKEIIAGMDLLMVTEVFSLDYAKAESLKDKINEMVSKGAGSVKFDEKTNKLVVRDTNRKIEDIRKVIDAFDEKTREVLIDANIVQVTLSDKYSYGIDWADIAKLGDMRIAGAAHLGTGLSNTVPSTMTVATEGGNHATVLSLLKTYGETNVLSSPRITVTDGQEAKILVGSKEAYVTSEVTTASGGTYHTTDHVQFVDVGVRLSVIAEINKAGFVTMKIKPEVSSTDATKTVTLKNPDGSTRTIVPYVTISEAETSVVVKDNTTIVIGGLMKDTIVEHREKVPFLGDLPLLGGLFSSVGKSKEKIELVIFLTPHIIEGDAVAGGIDLQKYEPAKKAAVDGLKPPPAKSLQKWPEQKKAGWTPLFGAKAKSADRPKLAAVTEDSGISHKTPYEEYYFTLREEISDIAKRDKDISGIKGEVQMQFTLDREGFLVRGPVVLNNPDLRLVRSAVKTVKNSVPFSRFPKALKKDQADFNVVIRYE